MNQLRLLAISITVAFAIFSLACSDADNGENQNIRQGPNQDTEDTGPEDTGIGDAGADEADADAGGDESNDVAADTDPATDADDSDTGAPTSELDCQTDIDTSAEFSLTGTSGAYYARTAFAGDAIWVVYSAVVDIDGDTVEKAHLVRYDCGGNIVDEPTLIGTEEDDRELHTTIVAGDDRVYTAWVQETSEGQRVMARAFELDGRALQDEPFQVIVNLKSGEEVGTLWKPDVAVTPDGNAVIVVEGLTSAAPKTILQRFDDQGNTVLNGFLVYDSSEHGGQLDPAVTTLDDGTTRFAYLGGDFGEGKVYQGTVGADADDPDASPIAADPTDSASNSVRYSKNSDTTNRWVTYPLGTSPQNSLVVRDASITGPGQSEFVDVAGRVSIYGDVAASDTGGALAWMTYLSTPSSGQVHFQRFDASADATISGFGDRIDQHSDEDAAWPYGPNIVWLFDEIYAAVWTENHDNLEVHGRIIDLP